VTEFFRNAERFEDLRQRVLPALLEQHRTLKIWSAGCSLGAELLSVGMLLEEMNVLDRCELVGTDVDHGIIQRARQGLFTHHELQTLPEGHLERYFEPEGNNGHRFVGEAIMGRTDYQTHNLLTDAPLEGCHLILCRNVVIYFSGDSKQRLYEKFVKALVPGGVLFVGSTERIFEYRDLGLSLLAPFFYQRPLG
jgi:chemotaxis protein methyltransferase CheR